jgi:protein CpxP
MIIKTSTAALLASLLLPAMALPVGAIAQTQTPVGDSTAPATEPAAKPKAAMRKPVSMAARVEQHITQLHASLHITPAQQPQWDQFAQVMRDNAKSMDETLQDRSSKFASMNAVEDMQSYAKIAQQHADDTQKLATAFQTLYGSLSDDQKKNADTVFRANGAHPAHKG